MMFVGDFLQYAPSGGARVGKSSCMTEGAVRDHGGAVGFPPRYDGMLDRPFAQMVKNLIAGRMARAGDPADGVEIGRVEVAHAPRQDLALAPKLLEGGDRVLQRVGAAPVQEITVQAIGPEARQRPFARRHGSVARCIL